jgi:hypothetical protein
MKFKLVDLTQLWSHAAANAMNHVMDGHTYMKKKCSAFLSLFFFPFNKTKYEKIHGTLFITAMCIPLYHIRIFISAYYFTITS